MMQSEQERQQACAGGPEVPACMQALARVGSAACFWPQSARPQRQALHAPYVVCSYVQQTGGESFCLWRDTICWCWVTLIYHSRHKAHNPCPPPMVHLIYNILYCATCAVLVHSTAQFCAGPDRPSACVGALRARGWRISRESLKHGQLSPGPGAALVGRPPQRPM